MFKEVLIYSSAGFKLVDTSLRITENSKSQVDFLEIADVVNTVLCITIHEDPVVSRGYPVLQLSVPGLPPNERVKKLRMDVHDNTVRLWEKAKKSRDEIVGEKALHLGWIIMNYQHIDDELDVWILGIWGLLNVEDGYPDLMKG